MSRKEPQPRLGRGLAALLGDSVQDGEGPRAESGGVHTLAVDLLDAGSFQPRHEIAEDTLAELVESIRARGILQPILARPDPAQPGRYQIIAGERRWRAAQMAGLHAVPVLLRELSNEDAMAASLVENLQRQDLNAIEEAEGYKRLLGEFGLTQERLATAVGKSRSHVANTLRLLNLPETVRAELRRGALTSGHARALLAHPDPARAALQVLARGLNVRQTEALAAPRPSREAMPVDPETRALEASLAERLGLRVQIAFDGKGGAVHLHYRSLDQLDGLVALLSAGRA